MKIKKIHSIFTHNNKSYVLFDIESSNHNYLYIFNPKNQNRSLLCGEDLNFLIPKYLKNSSIDCLECSLGSQILGAVSLDNGDIAQSYLSLEEANKILKDLKHKIKEHKDLIKLF